MDRGRVARGDGYGSRGGGRGRDDGGRGDGGGDFCVASGRGDGAGYWELRVSWQASLEQYCIEIWADL